LEFWDGNREDDIEEEYEGKKSYSFILRALIKGTCEKRGGPLPRGKRKKGGDLTMTTVQVLKKGKRKRDDGDGLFRGEGGGRERGCLRSITSRLKGLKGKKKRKKRGGEFPCTLFNRIGKKKRGIVFPVSTGDEYAGQ